MKYETDDTNSRNDGPSDEQLHKLHDDELTADERARIEVALDATGREKLAALGDLRSALRHALAAEATLEATKGKVGKVGQAGQPWTIDVWSAVEREMDASPRQAPPAGPRVVPHIEMGRVLPFGERAKRAMKRPTVWASSLVAAAAAVALYFATPKAEPDLPGADDATSTTAEAVAPVGVDEVEADRAWVTVFEVDDDEGEGSNLVVWLTEDEDDDADEDNESPTAVPDETPEEVVQ